jgi:hypothetical protein
MNKLLLPALFLLPIIASASPRNEWFRDLQLDHAIVDADIIIATQVIDVSESKLIRGGKSETAYFQYRLKPVHVLKGVFARDELTLGSSELGLTRVEQMREIRPGTFRLLFLGRSDTGYSNCIRIGNTVAPYKSMPPLADAHDPLLDAVRALIAGAGGERSRRPRRSVVKWAGESKGSWRGDLARRTLLPRSGRGPKPGDTHRGHASPQ